MKEIRMKVIVAGEPGSGKSIISEGNDACLPLKSGGVSIGLKSITNTDAQVCFSFITWTITKGRPKDTSYYEGSKAGIIVCDLTKLRTVKRMKTWAKSIRKCVGKIPLVFVGNNREGTNRKTFFLMLKIAKTYDSPVVLTRLGDKGSLDEIFTKIIKAI